VTDRRVNAAPIALIVLLLLLPCLYVGSYLALKTRTASSFMDGPLGYEYACVYRIRGPLVCKIFAPLQWADRRLRPSYWLIPGLEEVDR
jgi:hypothetical protein